MYIQITTRCNMSCAHCCYSCGKQGEDMPFSMFQYVLNKWGYQITEENKYWIVLGGGEPTLHPDFWKILAYSKTFGEPWVATNGSITDDALTLAKLAKKGIYSIMLSLDEWHDPISPIVINAFKNGLKKNNGEWDQWDASDMKDKRCIRSIITPHKKGRAKVGKEKCVCKLIRITPNGTIKGCGCEDAPTIGNICKGIYSEYSEIPWFHTCSKEWDFDKKRSKWIAK